MPIEDADAQHIVTLSVNAADGSMFSQDEDDLFTAGSTVYITVTPNGENSVRGINVTAEDGTKVDCALQGRVYPTEAGKTVYTINSPVIYQFTMPAQAVTVAAEFWDYDSVPRGCTPIDQNNFPEGHYTFTMPNADVTAVATFRLPTAYTPPEASNPTYSGAAVALATPGSTDDGTMEYSLDGESWSTAMPKTIEAGSYTLYYRVLGDAAHTDIAPASIQADIAQMDIAVAVYGNTLTETYDGAEHTAEGITITILGDDTGLYSEDDIAFSGTAQAKRTAAGKTDMGLTADNFANTNASFNVTFDVTDGYVEIAKRTLAVKADAKEKTYGDPDPALTYTVTGLAGDETEADVLTGALSVSDNQITQGTLAANNNYTITFTGAALAINPKPVTVTITGDRTEVPYDGQRHTAEGYQVKADSPLYSANDFVFYPTETDPAAVTTVKRTDKGETLMNLDPRQFSNLNGNFYVNFVIEDGYVKISPKPITVTAVNDKVTKTYGDADPDLTYTVKPAALADAVTGKLNRAAGQGVGTYAIRGDNLTVDANYSLNVVPGTLTIDQRPLTVKVNQKSKTYGEDDPGFTCTAEGLVAGDSPSLTVTRAAGENVGSYDFTCDNAVSYPNYDITVEGKFTVTPKQVGLSWSTDPLTYNGYNQKLAATATGLEDGDSCTVTVEGDGVDAGTYTATAVSLSNPNYKLPYAAYCTQPYTIGKADKADEAAPNAVTVAFKGVESGKLDLSSALKGATDWTVKGFDGVLVTDAVFELDDAGRSTAILTYATANVGNSDHGHLHHQAGRRDHRK